MTTKPRAMRDVFLEQIWMSMELDEKIFFISADFGSPVLDKIRKDYPERFINVGIAEQNLINITAGLALEGFKVFAYAIAPFITMRCYEQIRINLALLSKIRQMNVSLIGVGAGYSYVVSGPTHQCYEDITLMRALPNFRVLSPADHITAKAMFTSCLNTCGLKYIRMDAQVLPVVYENKQPDIENGFHIHNDGKLICLIATGYMLHTAKKIVIELEIMGYKVGLIDLYDLSSFDTKKLCKVLSQYSGIISMEEGFRGRGGMDSMLFELISRNNLLVKMLNLGVEPDYRFDIGDRNDLHEKVGIGPEVALNSINEFLESFQLKKSLDVI